MKNYPPKTTDETRNKMRLCLYSETCADTLQPGYRCTRLGGIKIGKWCTLYTQDCKYFERFPESQDT